MDGATVGAWWGGRPSYQQCSLKPLDPRLFPISGCRGADCRGAEQSCVPAPWRGTSRASGHTAGTLGLSLSVQFKPSNKNPICFPISPIAIRCHPQLRIKRSRTICPHFHIEVVTARGRCCPLPQHYHYPICRPPLGTSSHRPTPICPSAVVAADKLAAEQGQQLHYIWI
jgi:hypothetical protein